MKGIYKKRYTPRNLVVDMMNSLYEYNKLLKLINRYIKDDQIINISSIEEINKHLGVNLHDEANKIKHGIKRILDEYHEHDYWRAFNQEEISLDINTTLGETISYLEQMISPKDSQIIISNMLNGNLLRILNHLESLCQNSTEMSKQIAYDYQRNSLDNIIKALGDLDEYKLSINNLKRDISRLKPLKPTKKIGKVNLYVCPNCHQELIGISQLYCHHCGQRLSEH